MILHTSMMSPYQMAAYRRSQKNSRGTSFFIAEQQAANFVFLYGHWIYFLL